MSKAANARYDAKSTKHYGFKFNIKTDADIIAALDASPNKQALIKEALRTYIGKETTMYDELLKAAIKYDASFEDKKALADWLFQHGNTGWNGEAWDISDSGSPTGSRMMRPVYGPDDEYGDAELIDYEII